MDEIFYFKISEIHKIEEKSSGLYTWYWRPNLSDFEISNLNYESSTVVSDFLNQKIFSKLKFTNYEVQVAGELMPSYSGSLKYIGFDLKQLERHFEDLSADQRREVVLEIKNFFLRDVVPWFSSPLYIGISKHIGIRIKQHTRLMINYSDHIHETADEIEEDLLDDFDRSFASSVATRGISPDELVVAVKYLKAESDRKVVKLKNIIEFILNRTYYPICGKR